MDLAFKYALRHVDFSPIPMGSSSTRNADTIKQQEDWNAQVDSYIASGVDSRTKEQIELGAKIGPDHGPLHRRCEGVGCNKLEGRDETKMNTCGKCRMSFYCSRGCQANCWKTHKGVCGKPQQRGQALSSQMTMMQIIKTLPQAIDLGHSE